MSHGSAGRPGPPGGGRAVVVPEGGEHGPPGAWAPAVLVVHAALLAVAVAVGKGLEAVGVRDSGSGAWGSPGASATVLVGVLAVAVVGVVAAIRRMGVRRPRAVVYWMTATACWGLAPLAWTVLAVAVSAPEITVWVLVLLALTPYGWILLGPLLVFGGVQHLVSAPMKS
ncbi:hypothetical protein DQ237_09310 [Blastococcus sp. TF02-8]|uniref:hypothetical protein n=1 Tax=Blastococcus sp. TF02-8 TaxID=2250574 RepID=UPI000DEBED73|nr:hypothetical protein [Blastococcus sp. TF02-8]RBY96082.1 hypothetical protein DQ237_09310 [Blastococcus sp. TF02-8]